MCGTLLITFVDGLNLKRTNFCESIIDGQFYCYCAKRVCTDENDNVCAKSMCIGTTALVGSIKILSTVFYF